MKKTNNNAIIVASIISGVILIIALSLIFFGSGASSDTNVVTVEGVGSVKVMPDVLTVNLRIETLEELSKDAKDKNAEIMEKVIAALIAEGFERSDLITENFNIYEQFDWTEDGRESLGFKATHGVSVELGADESEKLGVIIDAAVDAGATIGYINFALSTELQNKYKAEAMKVAARDAKVKAESVAEGFDARLGKLVSVQVNDFRYSPWMAYGVMEDAAVMKSAATDIQVGEEEVTARVSATYKLR